MSQNFSLSGVISLAMAASALAILPVTPDDRSLLLAPQAALAQGGGEHGGGDHGGGDRGGSDHGSDRSADRGDRGMDSNGGRSASQSGRGSTASTLGSLNAGHASVTALAHASPNSRVGELATYKSDLAAFKAALASNDPIAARNDLAAAAQALAMAANKTVTADAVAALNKELGISASTATDTRIAQLAEATRQQQRIADRKEELANR